jgi:hypothetical protein
MRCLLSVIFLAGALCAGAETVTIGTGNLINQSLPFEPVSNYSYSQQLYFASEIGSPAVITSIAFQYSIASAIFWDTNNSMQAWLGHTSRSQLDSWADPDSLTLVWDGVLSQNQFSGGVPGSGWFSAVLETPFDYDGQSNLLLAVLENAAGHGATNDEFLCSAASFPRARVVLNSAPIDPASLPAQTVFVRQSHANLRLEMNVQHWVPCQPQPDDGEEDVSVGTDLAWISQCGSFDLQIGLSPSDMQTVATGLSTPLWHPSEPLGLLSQYFWQVTGYQDNEVFPGPVWSFTTAGEDLGPPRNFSAICVDGVARLSWQPPLTGNPDLYLIYRDGQFWDDTTGLSYWDSTVQPGGSYIYYAKSHNALGQVSLPSETASVHIPAIIPDLILEQGFEDCEPFTQVIPGWLIIDADGMATWGWDSIDFPGEGSPLAWLVFSSQLTDPPFTSLQPHTGTQMLMSADAVTAPDDNWLISPSVFLGESPEVRFWARSATAAYGLERLQVLISTQGTDPQHFVPLHTTPWLEIPAVWTEYDLDLSQWQNTHARIAWRAVSASALALFLDDIVITGAGGSVPSSDPVSPAPKVTVYPNPSSGDFRVDCGEQSFDLAIYDLRGRRLYGGKGLTGFASKAEDIDLPSGIYIIQVGNASGVQTKRLAVIK